MTLLAICRRPVLLRMFFLLSPLTAAAFYIYHAANQMRDTRSSLIVYFISHQQFSILMTLLAIGRRPVLLRISISSLTSHSSNFLHLPRCYPNAGHSFFSDCLILLSPTVFYINGNASEMQVTSPSHGMSISSLASHNSSFLHLPRCYPNAGQSFFFFSFPQNMRRFSSLPTTGSVYRNADLCHCPEPAWLLYAENLIPINFRVFVLLFTSSDLSASNFTGSTVRLYSGPEHRFWAVLHSCVLEVLEGACALASLYGSTLASLLGSALASLYSSALAFLYGSLFRNVVHGSVWCFSTSTVHVL